MDSKDKKQKRTNDEAKAYRGKTRKNTEKLPIPHASLAILDAV